MMQPAYSTVELMQTQQGYTLLEVMLAIVIIASISVFSMSIFQQQSMNSQIDRVGLQVQQWLEAAKAYYVDNNAWPDGYSSANTDCTTTGKDPTVSLLEGNCGPAPRKQYIQAGLEQNAWGQAFRLLPPSQQANPGSVMFQVESPVPLTLKNPIITAQRLASKLPNAIVVSDAGSVGTLAAMTIPGSASVTGGNIVIQSITSFTCSRSGVICKTINKPVCTGNLQPNIYLSLQGFNSAKDDSSTSTIGPVTLTAIETLDQKAWQIRLNILGPQLVHAGAVLAMITCEVPPITNKRQAVFAY